ncbi:cupin domain-containing protein [Nodularia sphaerocarpa]|uniref:cupin domain-containing protein n=1 Tax=Nodularia sphaerocarpa TaxID=137816 RepID=UPI001EFB1EDE|nr:cupin domain-containing protein [Nodularia sphaerocarpa]MDB9373590.1 cupin domain-containing protein [Nodularia sphaerocarpa CS-585]MDB9378025.1 cupin domain-containing protein [Nodularia sphaerocarpa CS-585A2]ULP74378.1 NADPH-dependent alkenal double bond reductase [Nodularia sphaerocarpa UHCC 0038]
MSKFFPPAKSTKLNSDVELIAFECQDTLVQLVYLAPGSNFPLHEHLESQMGMIISGRLEMNVNGIKEIIQPLEQAYIANAFVPHGSVNIFPETALVFDVKRVINSLSSPKSDEVFLKVSPTKDKITGFSCQSIVASWFEIAITEIPPGGIIPMHQSVSESMGIILNGQLMMTVEKEAQELKYGSIYYAPADVLYGGYNSSDQAVTLVEIMILPCADLSYQAAAVNEITARSLTAT